MPTIYSLRFVYLQRQNETTCRTEFEVGRGERQRMDQPPGNNDTPDWKFVLRPDRKNTARDPGQCSPSSQPNPNVVDGVDMICVSGAIRPEWQTVKNPLVFA